MHSYIQTYRVSEKSLLEFNEKNINELKFNNIKLGTVIIKIGQEFPHTLYIYIILRFIKKSNLITIVEFY